MTTLRMIPGITYTRKNLEALTGMPDRENRRMIREQRRQGVPIVAMKDGGYKLAETEEEKQALLSMYRKRALDELGTYRRLEKAMQVDGQMEMGGGNGCTALYHIPAAGYKEKQPAHYAQQQDREIVYHAVAEVHRLRGKGRVVLQKGWCA